MRVVIRPQGDRCERIQRIVDDLNTAFYDVPKGMAQMENEYLRVWDLINEATNIVLDVSTKRDALAAWLPCSV